VEAAVVLVDRDLGQTSLFFCCLAGQDGFEEFVLVLADPVLTDPELAGLGIALVGVLVLLVGVLAVLVVLLGLVLAVLGFGVRVLGGVGFFGVVTGFFGRILLALLLLVIGKEPVPGPIDVRRGCGGQCHHQGQGQCHCRERLGPGVRVLDLFLPVFSAQLSTGSAWFRPGGGAPRKDEGAADDAEQHPDDEPAEVG